MIILVDAQLELHTFINAFESSPVHCLNLRPSGNRRSPGKGGTMAMLNSAIRCMTRNSYDMDIPSVNICHDFGSMCWAVLMTQVRNNPRYKVVLECPFDELMKEIRG